VAGLAALAQLLAALALATLSLAGSPWDSPEQRRVFVEPPAALLAAAAGLAALVAALSGAPAAGAAREARLGFATRGVVATAAVLPLGWIALAPAPFGGSAVAAGAQGLALLGLLLLSAYLCLHLRASLLRARYWAGAVVLVLARAAAARAWGFEPALRDPVVWGLDLGAALAVTALSRSLPGDRPASAIPLGELAALAALSSAWAWSTPGPVALWLAGASGLGLALWRWPRLSPAAQAACAGLACALLVHGPAGGSPAVPLLACALAAGSVRQTEA
jgi:hypothetical protein